MASKKGTMKGHTIGGGHKRPTKSGAGMTKKGVAKYRKDNPGSKLKTAVTGKVKPGSTAHQTHPTCLLYTSPSPRDGLLSRMPSSA